MSTIEDSLEAFVARLAEKLASFELPLYLGPGGDCRGHVQMLLSPMPPQELAGELVPIIGMQSLKRFYEGYMEKEPPPALCISSFLFDVVPIYCFVTPEARIGIRQDELKKRLENYVATVNRGDMPVLVSLRLANVDLLTDFEIEPGVWLRKASEEEIRKKYPVDSTFIGVSRAVAESWFKHRVEVVFEGNGKGKDLFRLDMHEEHDATVNSILHSFLLSGVQQEVPASVTHYRYDTPLRSYGNTRNVDRVRIEPTLLSNEHLRQLKHTYQFLKAAKADKILRTALDRFLFGLSRPSHHPTEANRPNWDKVVDYVIAMETLFVPSKGPDVTYRLAVNGASLICLATSDHQTATYRALKCLYALRSKIVHGGTSDVVKDARKFLTCVGRTVPNTNDRLRIFHAICDHVESWLRAVLFYLGSISINRRPYSAKDDTGWEKLLWPPPSPDGNDYY